MEVKDLIVIALEVNKVIKKGHQRNQQKKAPERKHPKKHQEKKQAKKALKRKHPKKHQEKKQVENQDKFIFNILYINLFINKSTV